MMSFKKPIPLTLYIHIPWCIRKCPYCDFNSHSAQETLPEQQYISTLIRDLEQDLPRVEGRHLSALFIGGGTPSLLSATAIDQIITMIKAKMELSPSIETTLEANPGTFEQQRFNDYKKAGINRLSIGIQSFQNEKLKTLGRIHDGNESKKAINTAKAAGFKNINIDLMFGLPQQNLEEALADLKTAVSFNPTHLSWYQLTLEPNTLFYHHPPILPSDDLTWEMQQQGQKFLQKQGYQQYEISAFSKPGFECLHNRNYWEFGDYLGIGAGAHSKITNTQQGTITRLWKIKHPKTYMTAERFIAGEKTLHENELPLEFMLNALRLHNNIEIRLFEERTGLPIDVIAHTLETAIEKQFLKKETQAFTLTPFGRRFLNDVLQLFLK